MMKSKLRAAHNMHTTISKLHNYSFLYSYGLFTVTLCSVTKKLKVIVVRLCNSQMDHAVLRRNSQDPKDTEDKGVLK